MSDEEAIRIDFRIPSRLADFIEDWLCGAADMLDRHWQIGDIEEPPCSYGIGGNVITGRCELSMWGPRAPEYVQEAVRVLSAHGAEVAPPRCEHWATESRQ